MNKPLDLRLRNPGSRRLTASLTTRLPREVAEHGLMRRSREPEALTRPLGSNPSLSARLLTEPQKFHFLKPTPPNP